MNYFVTEEELNREIDKTVQTLLYTFQKYTNMMKEEIEREINKLRIDLEKKKMLDDVKEQAKRVKQKD